MGGKSKALGGALALAVGSIPFTIAPAGASEYFSAKADFNHTFKNLAGVTVVCPVHFSSELSRATSDDPYVGFAITSTDPTPECSGALAYVSATYRDTNGHSQNPLAGSPNGSVFLQVEDVGSSFAAFHLISFQACSQNCSVVFETQPK